MSRPVFSVVTTAKNERNERRIDETFDEWMFTAKLFEKRTGKKVEFVVVDAGGNVELPQIEDSTRIDSSEYEDYRRGLYYSGVIKHPDWDSPSIGKNLGFRHARGKIIVFQDIDSLFSTGTALDYRWINPGLDEFDNYFDAIYNAFRRKSIVGAAPVLRPRDSKKIGKRSSSMGMNFETWLSVKSRPIKIFGVTVYGPSVPGCSIALLSDVTSKLCKGASGPYDPELAIAEDHKMSRMAAEYGRITYERKAGVFIRTEKRVSDGFDVAKSLLYAVKWIPPYMFPDSHKYRKHDLSV